MADRSAVATKTSHTRKRRTASKKVAKLRAATLIRFIIRLGEVNFGGGPLFHRWLPRGIENSIETQVAVGHLQLWFERRGYTDNGMVRGAKVKDTDDLDIYGVYLEPPELVLGLDWQDFY